MTYPTKEEIVAYCVVIEPPEAIAFVKKAWLANEDVHALGFIVDGLLFNEWLSRYRGSAQD